MWIGTVFAAFALSAFAGACGSGDSTVQCGPGTVVRNGYCVPNGSDGDADADSDADSDSDADVDADTDGDSDGDADADTDSDGDVDGDADGDTDADGDADGDADCPDLDGDRHRDGVCGGDDCDDADPGVYQGAPDRAGDCIDQNCDIAGGPDEDVDGFASLDCGGDDCDDADFDTYPGAPDGAGDGADRNCDGVDGTDSDLDRHASVDSGGDDCDDSDDSIHPGAAEVVGDGIDQDCDGFDGVISPRVGHAMVFDDAGQRVVVFGGDIGSVTNCIQAHQVDGETWAYELGSDRWHQVDVVGPTARAQIPYALDTTRRRMVIFGGRFRAGEVGDFTLYDETWAFDLQTDSWNQLQTSEAPSARVDASMIFDSARDRMVLFGGNTSASPASFSPSGETWALDLATSEWTAIAQVGGPEAREFHSAAVTPDGSRMIVVAGGDENAFVGPFLRDAWALDLATDTWSALTDIVPGARISGMMVTVPETSDLVLFGGRDDGTLGNRNDLWRADVSGAEPEWTQVITGDELDAGSNGFCDFPSDFATIDLASPERRRGGGFASNADGTHVYLFGGLTDCGLTNDLWDLDVATNTWTPRFASSTGVACARSGRADCVVLCF